MDPTPTDPPFAVTVLPHVPPIDMGMKDASMMMYETYARHGAMLRQHAADPAAPLAWEAVPVVPVAGGGGLVTATLAGCAVVGLRVAASQRPFRVRVEVGGAPACSHDSPDGSTWTWISVPMGRPSVVCPLLASVAPVAVSVGPLPPAGAGGWEGEGEGDGTPPVQVFAATTDDHDVAPASFPFVTAAPTQGRLLVYAGRERPCECHEL